LSANAQTTTGPIRRRSTTLRSPQTLRSVLLLPRSY
jgi:hypothetical protein